MPPVTFSRVVEGLPPSGVDLPAIGRFFYLSFLALQRLKYVPHRFEESVGGNWLTTPFAKGTRLWPKYVCHSGLSSTRYLRRAPCCSPCVDPKAIHAFSSGGRVTGYLVGREIGTWKVSLVNDAARSFLRSPTPPKWLVNGVH